ncbi:hypothetical protein [Microcoleus sp. herbarium19]
MSVHLNPVGKSEVRFQDNLKISDLDRDRVDRAIDTLAKRGWALKK